MDDTSDLETEVVASWDFDDPAGSAVAFAGRAAAAESLDTAAVWQTQVARAYGLEGRFDEAHALLDSLDTEVLGEHAQARIAIERGRLLNSAGTPAEAGQSFGTAYFLASRGGMYGLAVDALHMTAIVVGQIKGPEAAAATDLAALELARASGDPNAERWVPALLNNLGWSQHALGDFEAALDYFEQALAARRAQEGSSAELLVAEWAIGRTLRSLGRNDEALALQRRLASTPEGKTDPYVAEEITACLTALARPH